MNSIQKVKNIYINNKGLLGYLILSYFDKVVVFLVPLLVLYFFKEKTEYVSIEYIYSIVLVAVPLLDLGISGFFYYDYRKSINKRASIIKIIKTFFSWFNVLFFIGIILIVVHYFFYTIDEYLIYIVFRVLFLIAFSFLAAYYRLIDNAKKALFITIISNVISLGVLLLYVIGDIEFNLFGVFAGQILFVLFFFYKTVRYLVFKRKFWEDFSFSETIKKSLLFSWPSIIQIFLMLFIANYGKIKAIDLLSLEEGALLSLTQRYTTLIQLTHSSLVAFLIKELYLSRQLEIKTKLFLKYLVMLFLSSIAVILILTANWYFYNIKVDTDKIILISSALVGYNFFWCIYSYLEIYYSIENKNIIKLYLAVLNGIVFIVVLNFLPVPFLERVTIGMLLSILVSLAATGIILKRRKYYFSK